MTVVVVVVIVAVTSVLFSLCRVIPFPKSRKGRKVKERLNWKDSGILKLYVLQRVFIHI